MIKRLSLTFVLVLLASLPLLAVGTATSTRASSSTGMVSYAVAWTSTAGGAVSGNAITVVPGRLVQVKVVPGAGGSQPTDLYDLTLVDQNSVDLLDGAGVDLSNSAGSYLNSDPPMVITNQTLDVVIANAGNAKSGTVTFWIQR